MKRRSVIALGVLAAVFPRAALAGPKGWRTLFDGRSLDGWTPIGEANWTLKDGCAQADNGKTGFLVSDETFGDVEIRAEFWVSDDANSGIFIRNTDPKNISSKTGYEVNIFDQRPDPSMGTGGIVPFAKTLVPIKAGGKWNVYEIKAQGPKFWATLNGTKTVDGAENADHKEGPIALQFGVGTVKFRKVQIRPL